MQQARYLCWKQAFHWLKSLWSVYLQNLSSVYNRGAASLKHREPEFGWKDKFFFIKKWESENDHVFFSNWLPYPLK